MIDINQLEKLYKNFCKQPMTDYCIINNNEKVFTDTGYALQGAEMFLEYVKQHQNDIDIIAIQCGKGSI